jgi:hypothetical protein
MGQIMARDAELVKNDSFHDDARAARWRPDRSRQIRPPRILPPPSATVIAVATLASATFPLVPDRFGKGSWPGGWAQGVAR